MRWLRRLALTLLTVLLLAVAGGLVVIWQYGPRVKAFVAQAVRDNIVTEVRFSDEMKVSLWHEFPRLSVELRNVSVQDAFRTDTLLMAGRVFVQIDVIKVLTDRLSIDGIRVKDGFVRIRQNSKGAWNYRVWKEVPDNGEATDLSIDRLALDDMEVLFDSRHSGLRFSLRSDRTELKGRFTDEDQRMGLVVNGHLSELLTNDMLRVHELPIELRADLHLSKSGKRIEVESGNALLNGNQVQWAMELLLTEKVPSLHIGLSGKDILPERLLPHVWPNMPQPIRNLDIRGRSDIRLTLDGPLSRSAGPELKATWVMRDGGIRFRDLSVSGLHFSADIHLPDLAQAERATFTFDQFALKTPQGQVSGDGQLRNLNDPYLVIRSKGRTRLEELLSVIGPREGFSGKGTITWDVVFEGPLGPRFRTTSADIRRMTWSGDLQFSDVALTLGGGIPPLKDLHGQVNISGAETRVSEFSGEMGHLVFDGSLQLENLRDVLSDSTYPLRFGATVSVREINVQSLAKEWSTGQDAASGGPRRPLRLSAQVDIGKLIHHGFTAERILGKIDINEGTLRATDLRLAALGGSVAADLQLAPTAQGTELYIDADLRQIDISRLLKEWKDFGQTTITSAHVRGRADADIQLKLPIDRDDRLIMSGMQVEADLRLSGGELIAFEPLKALSRFISVDELEHVRFDTLVNHFSIRNERLIIPYMRVNSSILNVDVYGEHGFNQELDYHVNLLLTDLLRRKARKKEFFEGHEIVDERGATRLFLWIRGRPGDIKVGFDRKEVRLKVKEDLRKEGASIKQLFKEEFGGRRQSTVNEPSPPTLQLDPAPSAAPTSQPDTPTRKRKAPRIRADEDEIEGEFRLEGTP